MLYPAELRGHSAKSLSPVRVWVKSRLQQTFRRSYARSYVLFWLCARRAMRSRATRVVASSERRM